MIPPNVFYSKRAFSLFFLNVFQNIRFLTFNFTSVCLYSSCALKFIRNRTLPCQKWCNIIGNVSFGDFDTTKWRKKNSQCVIYISSFYKKFNYRHCFGKMTKLPSFILLFRPIFVVYKFQKAFQTSRAFHWNKI